MEIVIGILALIAIGFALLFVASERHQLRLARFLRTRDRAGRERASVVIPTKGTVESARAVDELLDAMDEVRVESESAKRALLEDLAAFSHDVRTPLAGAQGYLQLYAVAESEAEREDCVRRATKRLDAMRSLVDGLYDYLKTETMAGSLSLKPVVLFDALADSLADAYPAFVERGWKPVVSFADASLAVTADPPLLGRLFDNLLTNCLRYGAAAPTITQVESVISFSNPLSRGEASLLDERRVFERFYRGNNARSGEGSGLGLATAKGLAEAMGMELSACVTEDTFTITLTFQR